MKLDRLDRQIAVAIFASLWVTYALIGPGTTVANSNVVPRIGLILAVVQNHTASIDSFAPFTVDKALFAGHYYLDNAPGLSLMAFAFVALAEVVARAIDISTTPIVGGALSPFFYFYVWLAWPPSLRRLQRQRRPCCIAWDAGSVRATEQRLLPHSIMRYVRPISAGQRSSLATRRPARA